MPVDNDVYDRLGASWWDDDSPLSLLHGVTPGRFAYFRDVLARQGLTVPGRLRALDIGCGGGFLAEEFAAAGWQVTGIDPSPASIAAARAHAAGRGLRITYRVGPGECLPVPDSSYDLAYCCDVLEHVSDTDRVMAEAARALRPGGLFAFDTINRTAASRLVMITLMQRWPATRLVEGAIHDWDMFITPGELTALMTRHGLQVAEITGLGPRAGLRAALAGFIAARRGRITYGELSRRLDVGQVRSTRVSYMGFAVKE